MSSDPLPGRPPVVTLPALPGLGGLYARGVTSSGLIAVRRSPVGRKLPGPDGAATLPDVTYRVAAVRTDGADLAQRLADYQRLLGERVSDSVPAGFVHVLAFPLATAVMVRPDFPLPLLGAVHVANRVSMLRPVSLGDVLEVRSWAADLRPHRRGAQVDLVTEVSVAGAGLAYRGISTYLSKGFWLAGAEGSRNADGDQPELVVPVPTARWTLGAGTGRAYGAISGDRNPIHTSALGARAFGFPRAIAHGMYTAARALAEVGPARGDAYDWTVAFDRPVLLPGTVEVAITERSSRADPSAETRLVAPDSRDLGATSRVSAEFTYVGWDGRTGRRHFEGTVVRRG